jgi:hypothetical protein
VNIVEASLDPNLFGEQFADDSFNNWRTLLKAFYGLPMDDADLEVFRTLTGRTVAPEQAMKELWLVVGRRGGKSQVAALIAVYEAFFHDYSAKLSVGEKSTVMVIAGDRKQARSVFRYIRGLVELCPMLNQMVLRETTETLELNNRSVIEITTASHRRTRGYTCSCVIADEISFWQIDGANPDREIINALRPSLATLGGKLLALSSPYARRGVLWDSYRDNFGKDNKRILVAQAPTALMNPTLDPAVIEQAYVEDPASASAEYGANFRTDVESFISREAVEAVTITDRIELAPAKSNRYVGFVDAAGGSGQDAMTMSIAHMDTKSNVAIVDAVRCVKPPFSPEQVVIEFCTLLKSYRITRVIGDAYSGGFIRELFGKRGIHYQVSTKDKSAIYGELLPLINSQRVELPDIKQMRDELIGLERKNTTKPRIDHAPGQHDDMINAVAGVLVFSSQVNNQTIVTRLIC